MTYDTRPDVIVYKEHKRTIQTLAWWCDTCGECILSGKSLKNHEAAFQKLKAENQKDRQKENTLIKIKQIDWKNVRAPK